MTRNWWGRMADQQVLIAQQSAVSVGYALSQLEDPTHASVLASAGAENGQGEFWTELGERTSKRLRPYNVDADGILHIPVRGVLLKDFPYQFLGYATGYEYVSQAIARGLDDENVQGIALIVNSSGGMVAGCFDCADEIYAARQTKPVRAYAMEVAYSAAYALASAASTITTPRTGGVGSIGVVTAHVDMSKMLDDIGYKITFIHFGEHKVDGNPYEALSPEVEARIQARIDDVGNLFVATVSRNRNLDAAAVRATEALTFTATEALENGLLDSIGTLETGLAEFAADLTNTDDGDETMSDIKTATVATVKAENADVADALIAEGHKAGLEEGKKEAAAGSEKAIAEAVAADRARVAEITALATPGADTIIADGIKSGASAGDVALSIMKSPDVKAAQQKAAVLAGLQGDEADAAAGAPAPSGDGAGASAVPQTEEGWAQEWEESAEDSSIRQEFSKAKYYVAHKKRESKSKRAA